MATALILGGAGFIGSNICHHLAANGFRVTAVDGLLPRTSGNPANLVSGKESTELIKQRVEDLQSLPDLLRGCDLVVDAMGWTSHWGAFEDPDHDLALNVASHLAVIRALPAALPKKLVYLGSTHQYGRVEKGPITETQPLAPVDVQGVHKAAAEHHYRIAAERHGFPVISLRFGNTFGPAQPLTGRDVGLVGDMIRRSLAGETIKVYGEGRYRTLHFAPDIARILEDLLQLHVSGFMPMNVPGHRVAVAELARQIASCTGGSVVQERLPAAVAAIDIGNVPLDCTLFEKHFLGYRPTPLEEAIATSIQRVKDRVG
jgi:UDP-glucose 4-epimerase